MAHSLVRVFVLSLALFAAVPTARATQIIYQAPEQMGQEATLVVRGVVSHVQSFWNETHTKIFTETIIAVDETYKGREVRTARVVQLGGVVGNVRVHVQGALSWRAGEEVLLFLEPDNRGSLRVTGFSQGKFDIERDPATGGMFITRPALEAVAEAGASGAQGAFEGAGGTAKVRLDEFLDRALGNGARRGEAR
jgi:hypothetical protein